jgi:hypothetical protein
MTLLCSSKVTHHHGQLGVVASTGKSAFLPQGKRRGGSLCGDPLSSFSSPHAAMGNALRTVGADEVK